MNDVAKGVLVWLIWTLGALAIYFLGVSRAFGQNEFQAAQEKLNEARETADLAIQKSTNNATELLALATRVDELAGQIPQPPPPLNLPFVTPADAPVPGHPDDGMDDTAALKWCLEFSGNHKPVILRPGRYELSETINTWRKDGVTVFGAGCLMETRGHPNHYGTATVIEWRGAAGGSEPVVMWKFGGAGLMLSGVTFDGRGVADVGFMSYNPERAMNGVKGQVGFWSMQNLKDVGWQFGAHGTDLGSDNFQADHLHAENCEWMYRIASEQAMDHQVDHFLSKTKNVFDIASGGRISVGSGCVPNQAKIILRVGAGTGAIGKNNGSIVFRNLWLDSKAQNAKIVQQVSNRGARILFDALHVAGGTSPEGAFEIQPWTILTISNSVNAVRPRSVTVTGSMGAAAGVDIVVSRSQLSESFEAGDLILATDPPAPLWGVRMRDNYLWNGRIVADSEAVEGQ